MVLKVAGSGFLVFVLLSFSVSCPPGFVWFVCLFPAPRGLFCLCFGCVSVCPLRGPVCSFGFSCFAVFVS